jgi:hypothetical protein
MDAPRSGRPETRSALGGAEAPTAAPPEADQPGCVSGPRRQDPDTDGQDGLPGEPEENEDDGFVPL